MKRHPALVRLSHDHQHALAWATRLRRGHANGFSDYYAGELVAHFRREEETVFPLLLEVGCEPPELTQALLDHQRIRARSARPDPSLGELIEAHVRLEERVLFETIQHTVPDELLATLLPNPSSSLEWATATADLNATLLAWPPGSGPPVHTNSERDVVLVVLTGSAELLLGNTTSRVNEGQIVVIEKGQQRRITAGAAGVRYLTVHTRRPELQITPVPPKQDASSSGLTRPSQRATDPSTADTNL